MLPPIPNDLKEVNKFREFFMAVRTQACGMADYLQEPWKGHFNQLKDQYDTALASLPPTDQVPAALDASKHLSCFFSCLANANALVSMLGSAMNSLMQKKDADLQTALNSALPAEIQKRITAGELVMKATSEAAITAAVQSRIDAKELVPKDMVVQLCSAAKEAGMTEGENKVRGELTAKEARTTKIAERKGQLQTASLPLPSAELENILGGTDEEFTAAKTLATNRIAALQKKGIALNSKSGKLAANVWLPENQYQSFEELVVQTVTGGDPLITTASNPTGAAPTGMIV